MLRTSFFVMAALFAQAWCAQAQIRRPSVTANGSASVSVAPDQVSVILSVTTQAATAQEATTQNAGKVSNLLGALRKLLGSTGEIRTLNVNVSPITRSPGANQPPQTVAYLASNTLQVTVTLATVAGTVIDTAVLNGASSVGALQFGLKDPEPTRLQALRIATQQAKTHAEAIAFALGRTLGSVVAVSETGSIFARAVAIGPGIATGTPIEAGPLEVSAAVVLEAELN